MSQSHLTHWIEDADARELCRDATFLTGVEQQHCLHLGAAIIRIAEWWHHNVTEEFLRTPQGSQTQH